MTDIKSLLGYGASIEADKHEREAYKLTFVCGSAITTIRVLLQDYSGADLVITNMTTLPHSMKSRGFGTRALQTLLEWATEEGFTDIRAVQVQSLSETFWSKNGFTKCPEPNPCNDFKYNDRQH